MLLKFAYWWKAGNPYFENPYNDEFYEFLNMDLFVS